MYLRLALIASASIASIFSGSLTAFASAHHMFEDEAELALISSHSDEAGAWNTSNNPASWSPEYVYEMDRLPLEGMMADHTPWSDTYWPSNKAGIAARWNWAGSNGFKYALFSEAQVRMMGQAELARLSPAEKYDIFMGHFDYPTVKSTRSGTSSSAEYWQGICHGWSPAAINHAEPAPVTVAGPSGILVPFASADVKALMDQYYADNSQPSAFLGVKCQYGHGGNIFRRIANPFMNGPSCDDVNAGALHVILANELGIRHQGFIADVDRFREVWNQPIYGFSSQVRGYRSPSSDAAPGTVREAIVHTEMYYADEIEPTWKPVVGTPDFKVGVGKYDYTLELDGAGRIVGGQYITSDRPDFLWNAPRLQFTGYFEGINQIYRPEVVR